MPSDHETLAARLRAAYAGSPVAPLRDGLDPDDVEGAYAVQAINTRFWTGSGRRIVGYKIGLTSLAVQRQLGVDQPDFGVLFDDMCVPDGGTLSASKLLQPKVEAEVALVLARDLDREDASPRDVEAAAAYVVSALEIVDSRIADWTIRFADTVADNGSSAFFVLGTHKRAPGEIDLAGCEMSLTANGVSASSGTGAACLGHPLNAAAWLARTLSARGVPLRAGDVLMTGALGPMLTLEPGMTVQAQISGLGAVGFHFNGD